MMVKNLSTKKFTFLNPAIFYRILFMELFLTLGWVRPQASQISRNDTNGSLLLRQFNNHTSDGAVLAQCVRVRRRGFVQNLAIKQVMKRMIY